MKFTGVFNKSITRFRSLALAIGFSLALSACKGPSIRGVAQNDTSSNSVPSYSFTKISNAFPRNWMTSADIPFATEIYGKIIFIGDNNGDHQLAYYDSSLGYAKFLTASSLGFTYQNVQWLAVENGHLYYVAFDAITTRQNMYRLNSDLTATMVINSNTYAYQEFDMPKSNDLVASAGKKELFFRCRKGTAGNWDRLCSFNDFTNTFTEQPETQTISQNWMGSFDFLNDDVYFDSLNNAFAASLYRLRNGAVTALTPGGGGATVINGLVYYVAGDGGGHAKLFKFNPTGSVVTQISDTHPGWDDNISQMTKVGNNLFLSMGNATFGRYLYMYDGVGASVVQVSNTSGNTNDQPNIQGFFYGKLYFGAIDGTGNLKNYTILGDGTGQTQLPVVNAGTTDYFTNLTAYNSKIYMSGYTIITGFTDLYSYDPVANAYTLVKSLNGLKGDSDTSKFAVTSLGLFMRAQKTINSIGYKIPYLMNTSENFSYMQGDGPGDDGVGNGWYVNGKLYLYKYNSNFELKIFEHDIATGLETQMCDSNPGLDDYVFWGSNAVFGSSGHLYMSAAYHSLTNFKLVRCEGGVATQVSNINPGGTDDIQALVQIGNKYYFPALNNLGRVKLYSFSHLGGLSGPLTNINGAGSDSISAYLMTGDATLGKVYFAADSGTGDKVYMIDATTNVVTQVSNTNAGGGDNAQQLKVIGNKLYFLADDGAARTKLREYAPATAPALVTAPLVSIFPGNPDTIQSYDGVNGSLYINVSDPLGMGNNLYRYNLSTSALTEAFVINGSGFNNESFMAIANGVVYFAPYDSNGFVSVHRYSSSVNDQAFKTTSNGDDQIAGLGMTTHSTALITYSKDAQNFYRLHYYDGTNSGIVGKVNAAADDTLYPIASVANVGLVTLSVVSYGTYSSTEAYLWNYK